jgi:hypothetical protein
MQQILRSFPQPVKPCPSLLETNLGDIGGAQISVQRMDANLGHRADEAQEIIC